MKGLFTVLARIPLRVAHSFGAAAGWLVYLSSPAYATRLRDNFNASGIGRAEERRHILRRAVAEAGGRAR